VRSVPAELGKKLSLADERLAGLDDGLFVDGRGDEGIEFMAQAALGAIKQPRNGGFRSGGRTRDEFRRQRFGERVMDEETLTRSRA